MRYHEFLTPEHPAKRERPRDIARINVLKAELADMKLMQAAYGSEYIVSVEKFPVIDAFTIEVLCPNPDAAAALLDAWLTYCEASPFRQSLK